MKNNLKVLAVIACVAGSFISNARALELPGSNASKVAQYSAWKHSGSIFILTTPEGADLPATAVIENFPLLVRLHKDSFDFRLAKADGADLRFTTSDGTPLAYQNDEWDAARGEASVWVRVPKITGNSRQEIELHWGNADAVSESNGATVFNESNGYLSVLHLSDPVKDEVGTVKPTDDGTTASAGMIGPARRFGFGKGINCGETISTFPTGASDHSSEVWFRAEVPNALAMAWGNEHGQGKITMRIASPPHVQMECYFSGADIRNGGKVTLGQWTHVVHTYRKGDSRVYVNGVLDGATMTSDAPLAIKSPARMYVGGWYHDYRFVGEIDEVRVSNVVRSPDWVKLQYENQMPLQTAVGSLVQPGQEFAVSSDAIKLNENQSVTVTAKAGGAQKIYWILQRGGIETVVATDRLNFTFDAGRVVGNQSATLQFKAIYPDGVKTEDIAITITEDVPEPIFTLKGPDAWDGRQTIEIVPQIANLAAMRAKGAGELKSAWTVDGLATIKQVELGKLILKRGQNSGLMTVSVAIDNGGEKIVQSMKVNVTEPLPSKDTPWIFRIPDAVEQPEDDQFIARDLHNRGGEREGTLYYRGTLDAIADSVFVRVFSDDQLFKTESNQVGADKTYSLSVKLKPGLIKYRTEFGSKTGDRETVLHKAANIVCGDVFLINGQSNAVATDFGKDGEAPPINEWVRTFGSTAGDPNGSRLKLWGTAQARSPGGKSEIGYWGMELGRRLVESQKLPICIINGAVGGTRIDQHQRNPVDPTDAATIYGRLLWRVQQARLTHGVRAILWHQGENDQGADGPTGGYGFETYREFFIDLTAAWKEDYPNVDRYYAFQIWPKSCEMGINGSDNKLREVQRTLPNDFSNLTVMSTLGIKPPGGCHFPAAGYAEFARLIAPAIEYQIYHRFTDGPVTPPNLRRAFFASDQRDELVLEFDSQVVWQDSLASQFYLDGEAKQIASGSANSNLITLKLKQPSKATRVTYLDSASWSPDNVLYSPKGLAALTFCDVPISKGNPGR